MRIKPEMYKKKALSLSHKKDETFNCSFHGLSLLFYFVYFLVLLLCILLYPQSKNLLLGITK